MYGNWPDLFLQALQDTLEMTIAAGLIAFVAGLPLGLVLVASAPGGICRGITANDGQSSRRAA
jgi:D-methionine transport system permease protein